MSEQAQTVTVTRGARRRRRQLEAMVSQCHNLAQRIQGRSRNLVNDLISLSAEASRLRDLTAGKFQTPDPETTPNHANEN